MNSSSKRIYRSIIKSIEEFNLDLSGEVVLSELGTNEYNFVALIPILAKAKKVIIIHNEDLLFDQLRSNFLTFLKEFKVKNNNFLFVSKKELQTVKKEITIISNCGNVRPIDQMLVQGMDRLKVVGLMYDGWELRKSDVDVDYLTKNHIKLVAVNETHKNHNIFSYVGPLCAKLCMESKHEIMDEKFLVWSNDPFGKYISKYLEQMGAKEIISTVDKNQFYRSLPNLDVIVLASYNFEGEYFGMNGLFNEDYIKQKNSSVTFIHLFGKINKKNEIDIFPPDPGQTRKMSRTFSYLGYNPLYRLISAGFKVCEEVIKNELSILSKPINF